MPEQCWPAFKSQALGLILLSFEDHWHRTIWKCGTSGKHNNNSDYQQQTGFKSLFIVNLALRIHLKTKKFGAKCHDIVTSRLNIIDSCAQCEWNKLYEPFDAFVFLYIWNLRAQVHLYIHSEFPFLGELFLQYCCCEISQQIFVR